MIGKLLNGWKSLRENLLLSRKVDFGKACYNAIFKKKKNQPSPLPSPSFSSYLT